MVTSTFAVYIRRKCTRFSIQQILSRCDYTTRGLVHKDTFISALLQTKWKLLFQKGGETVRCSLFSKHPKEPKVSLLSAANAITKSKRFVAKWMERFKLCKNIDNYDERCSKRATTEKQDKA